MSEELQQETVEQDELEQPSESSTDEREETTDDQGSEESQPEEKEEGEESKKKNRVQERINQLTREKYEERQRAEQLETRLKEMEERINTLDKPPEKPKWQDFDSDDEYERAMENYIAKKRDMDSRRSQTEQQKQQIQEEQQREAAKRAQDFSVRAQKEADRYQGFWDAVSNDAFSSIVNAMDKDVVAQIQSSDKSTGLAYHLATNLDVADSIARMSPVNAARELVKLEMSLETPEAKQVTNAPPPTKPIGSGKSVDVPLSDTDKIGIDDWMKKRNAQVRGKK